MKRGREKLPDRIKRKTGREFESILREYAAQPLTPEQVAGELGCCVKSLLEYGEEYGAEIVRRIGFSDRANVG